MKTVGVFNLPVDPIDVLIAKEMSKKIESVRQKCKEDKRG